MQVPSCFNRRRPSAGVFLLDLLTSSVTHPAYPCAHCAPTRAADRKGSTLKPAQSLADRLDEKVFTAIYSRSLVYNACWEDPLVDRRYDRVHTYAGFHIADVRV